jgi:glycosyltransferase involved in cell wall biosynthesis
MIGIDWRIGGAYGWGVFGLNLALDCARPGRRPAVPLAAPMELDLGPLHARLLAPALAEQRRLDALAAAHPGHALKLDATVLRGLAFDMQPIVPTRFAGRHEVGVVFFENTAFSRPALERAAAYDRVIAGSGWNAAVLRGLGLGNVVLAPQGVDTTLFHPAPKAGLLGDRFVVFAGGKLEHRKGQDIALTAFRRFHARHPEALLLTAWQNPFPQLGIGMAAGGLVDGDPAALPGGGLDIAGWAQANGLPPGSVIDCGLVPQRHLPVLLREADAALFTNRCEGGTNLVAMEAMACGLPTVLSANTGHLDLMAPDPATNGLATDGPAGDTACYPLLRQGPVRPTERCPGTEGWGESDPDEAVAALEAIHADRTEARRRGAAAAERMRSWSWADQVARLTARLPC